MPATETPKPAPGEIHLDSTPKKGIQTQMPDTLMAAALKAAGVDSETIEQPDHTKAPPDQKNAPKPAPEAKKEPSVKPAEPAKSPEPPKEPPKEPKLNTPKELREAYERSQKRIQEAEARVRELEGSVTATSSEKAEAYKKLADLEKKAVGYEQEIEKTYKPAIEQLNRARKDLQDREEKLRIRDYTATGEWHEKYERPLATARADAELTLAEINVVDESGDPVRQATAKDFDEVLAAPSLNEAAKVAKRLFGPDVFQTVVNHRTRIQQLVRSRAEAYKNAQLESIEWEKNQRSAVEQAKLLFRQKLAEKEAARRAEYQPPDDDTELNEALTEAETLIESLDRFTNESTPDEISDAVANARTRIRREAVMSRKLTRAETKIKELEQQLKEYQSSEPTVETRNGGSGPVGDKSKWEDTILEAANALATKNV